MPPAAADTAVGQPAGSHRGAAGQRPADQPPRAPRLRAAKGALVLAALLFLACTPHGARGQPTSNGPEVEPWPGDRLPKTFSLRPLAKVDVNLFPILFYTPETLVGYGLGTWLIGHNPADGHNGKPTNVWVSAVYTQQQQTIVRIIPELYYGGGAYRLQMRYRYLDFPTRFYGIGNDTPVTAEEDFTPVTHSLAVTLTRRLRAALAVGGLLDYESTVIRAVEPGKSLAAGTVQGAAGTRLAGVGLVLRQDEREQHFRPHFGSFLELKLARYRDLDDGPYAFTRVSLDARWFHPVLQAQVLGLQVVAQSVSGDVPFTSLPQLGGKFIMRGFFEGRYRDRTLLVLQSEYRIPIAGRWGTTLFASYGDVAQRLGSFRLGDFKSAGGIGLRYAYNRRERIHLRLDVAGTAESSGVYFSVGEAF